MDISDRKTSENQIKELILQATEQEAKYHSQDAIELLKKAKETCLANGIKELAAEVYYKLGETYLTTLDYERQEDKILKYFELSLESYQKARDIFQALKKEEMLNASLGFIHTLRYFSESEKGNEDNLLEIAKSHFSKASHMMLERGNTLESLKMNVFKLQILLAIFYEKLICVDEKTDFKELILEITDLEKIIWDRILTSSGFSVSYLHRFLLCIANSGPFAAIFLSKDISDYIPYALGNLNRFEQLIGKLENTGDSENLFLALVTCALIRDGIGWPTQNRFEQKKYFKKAERYLKRAEKLLLKIHSVWSLGEFYYTRFFNNTALLSIGIFPKDFQIIFSDFSNIFDYLRYSFPKIEVISFFLYGTLTLTLISNNASVPTPIRLNYCNKMLEVIKTTEKTSSTVNDPRYVFWNLEKFGFLCDINVRLAKLSENDELKSKYLRTADRFFNNVPIFPKLVENTFAYTNLLMEVAATGYLLAEIVPEKSEKLCYLQKAISFLEKRKMIEASLLKTESLFFLGTIYFQLGILTADKKIYEQTYLAYRDAIKYCENKGYFNLVGVAYDHIARIKDRLGDYLAAADSYKNAVKAFDKAIELMQVGSIAHGEDAVSSKDLRELLEVKDYVYAWSILEGAKACHMNEDHSTAQLKYEEASKILQGLRNYKFEALFYVAWAMLEKAEDLSKKSDHKEAAVTYLVASKDFENTINTFNSYLEQKRISSAIKKKISNLIKIGNIRIKYCIARNRIETARLESRRGNHKSAANLYSNASELFSEICEKFSIEQEKKELTAVFYLCKAWEKTESAEIEKQLPFYTEASELFKKASELFPESRMKQLALGNSLYCSALEAGRLFDSTSDLEEKVGYYKRIKIFLRDSSKNYHLGGFEQDAQWTLATSTFFDGVWQLIQSDIESNVTKKSQALDLAKRYLNTALQIFDEAGHGQKKTEILKYLKMVNDERTFLLPALDIIEKPAISQSSIGISASACPLEINTPVNIGAMQQQDLLMESERNWYERIQYLYLFTHDNGIVIYDRPFKADSDTSPNLVSGGLSGLSMLIQEITRKETNLKIIEQEDILIMLEHGKYLTGALITEENLMTLRHKLKQVIQAVEDFYQEELEAFKGKVSVFAKVGKIVEKIFGKT